MTNTQGLADELAALDRRATPGPFYTLDPPWLPGGSETSILARSPDPHVARFICDFDMWALDDEEDADRKSECPDADAALLVWLRNHVPEILTALRSDALDAKDAEIARVRAKTLEEAARVAEGWRSSLRPGTDSRLLGHREAARDIATAIRALAKDAS